MACILFIVTFLTFTNSITLDKHSLIDHHKINQALDQFVSMQLAKEQNLQLKCSVEDGPFCYTDFNPDNPQKNLVPYGKIQVPHNQTTPLATFNTQTQQFLKQQQEALKELEEDRYIGYSQLSTVLDFNYYAQFFKTEKNLQTSIPIHTIKIATKNELYGTVKGNLLARYQPTNMLPLLNPKKQEEYTQPIAVVTNGKPTSDKPSSVYLYVYSEKVVFELNKPLHFENFHYRINNIHYQQNPGFKYFVQIQSDDGIFEEVVLQKSEVDEWKKVSFPRNPVFIDRVIFSQGLELDNFSWVQFMRIKDQLSYKAIQNLPISRYNVIQRQNVTLEKINLEELKEAYSHLDYVGNTLMLISDQCTLQKIEKQLRSFENNKIEKKEIIANLQAIAQNFMQIGFQIIFRVDNGVGPNGKPQSIEVNFYNAVTKYITKNEDIIEVLRTLAKFDKTSTIH